MKKQKTRKELGRGKTIQEKEQFWFIGLLYIMLLVLAILLMVSVEKRGSLKTQLSECQEQVPVRNSNDCVDVEYWYNNGEGRDFNNINEIMLRDTINCLERVIE